MEDLGNTISSSPGRLLDCTPWRFALKYHPSTNRTSAMSGTRRNPSQAYLAPARQGIVVQPIEKSDAGSLGLVIHIACEMWMTEAARLLPIVRGMKHYNQF